MQSSMASPPEYDRVDERAAGSADHGPSPTPSLADWDEATVVARAQDGDLAAFDILVGRYSAPLYRLAVRMVRDRGLAEDLVQDTLITCWRKLPTLGDPAAFRGWLYRIVSHRSLDALRRQRVRPETVADDPEHGRRTGVDADDPQATAVRRAELAALNTELAALPDQLRLVWLMREINGLSYHEIATATGTGVATVRGRLARARLRLAERMEAWR